MVDFETIETKEIKFGTNKFLEVARKNAKTENGDNEFVSISKGFVTPTGQKRFKNALGFPADKEILTGLIEALQSLDISEAAAPAAEEAPAEEAPVQEEAPAEEEQ